MEGETFFVAFFPPEERWLVGPGHQHFLELRCGQPALKNLKGGDRNQDMGSTISPRDVEAESVCSHQRQVTRNCLGDRKVKQELSFFGGGREEKQGEGS